MIGISLLPKTFQDAIDTTRRLKMQFLCVYSLCIIQDLKENWAQRIGIFKASDSDLRCVASKGQAQGRLSGNHTSITKYSRSKRY